MPKTFSAEGATAGAGAVETPTSHRQSNGEGRRPPRQGGRPRQPRRRAAHRRRRPRLQRPRGPALGDELAGALGAVVGCTKSLADFEWLGEDRIIGLSGAKTAPDLYLSVGVSGQIQHTVGVAGAKLIAAVNKDKEAPIFAHGRLRHRRRPLRGGAGARRAPQERVTRRRPGAAPPARLASAGRPRHDKLLRRRETAPPERPGPGPLSRPRPSSSGILPTIGDATSGEDRTADDGGAHSDATTTVCRSPATATAAAAARCSRPSRAAGSRASATTPPAARISRAACAATRPGGSSRRRTA